MLVYVKMYCRFCSEISMGFTSCVKRKVYMRCANWRIMWFLRDNMLFLHLECMISKKRYCIVTFVIRRCFVVPRRNCVSPIIYCVLRTPEIKLKKTACVTSMPLYLFVFHCRSFKENSKQLAFSSHFWATKCLS